jgi:3-oxoacyl-[acyl-carrier protein] reductase
MSSTTDGARPVALVTGGSRGIGKAIVERLARAGLAVRFTYVKNEEAASAVVASLRDAGLEVEAERVDARDSAASRAWAEKALRERGRVDVLVNNAGVTADKLFTSMTEADWNAPLATSLNGMFGATQPLAKQMMRQRAGRIVNLTSVSGLVGIPGQANYCAAKAAIIGFTRALAKEMAPWGVAVNAVAPGFIDTDMTAGFPEAQRKAAVDKVPVRRFGTADEVAGLVEYLARTAPLFMTGQVLVIDGGMTG